MRNYTDQFLRSNRGEEQNKKIENIKQISKNITMKISCILSSQLQNPPLFQQCFVTVRSFLSVNDKNKQINK